MQVAGSCAPGNAYIHVVMLCSVHVNLISPHPLYRHYNMREVVVQRGAKGYGFAMRGVKGVIHYTDTRTCTVYIYTYYVYTCMCTCMYMYNVDYCMYKCIGDSETQASFPGSPSFRAISMHMTFDPTQSQRSYVYIYLLRGRVEKPGKEASERPELQ